MRGQEILQFIELIRDSVPKAVEVFTQGNCGNFGRILLFTFPEGKILYYLRDHIVFELGHSIYDITGCVNGQYDYKKLTPIEQEGDINKQMCVLTPRYKETG